MKKHYILTAAVALTLCACGGGNSNQNNASQTADTTNVASQENGDDKTQMVIQIMKELGVDDDFDPETINSTTEEAAKTLGVNSDYFRCVEEFDNHYKTVYNIFFYPLNSGGTEIIVELKTVGLDDDMYYQITDERHYCRQTFENGSLTKHDEVFPLTINDFYSNADKFPEPSRMALEEAVSKKLKVKFLDNNKIEVTLNPYETECICEGEYELMLPSTLCGLADKTKNIFPSVTMSWNGEKFVRESKPFEEDLKYFDNVKIPTGIIVEFWKLANNFDPKSTNDQNRIVGLVVNNTVIYEYFDGDEYSRMAQQYACYPLKSGGYLVLINVEQTDNYGVDVFKYDNGKIEKYNSNPFESDLFERKTDKDEDNFREHDYFPGYFVHYDEYSFTLQTNNAYSYFKWNGEKFTVAASNSNSYDTMEEISAKGTNIIKELYNKYVLGDENPTNENLKKYCTDKMIKYLWDQYSYDGEGIAIWCFRGNCHTEIMSAKITEIENLQGGFFRVHYVNGQEKEAYYCDVCAVLENGNVLIDSIVK